MTHFKYTWSIPLRIKSIPAKSSIWHWISFNVSNQWSYILFDFVLKVDTQGQRGKVQKMTVKQANMDVWYQKYGTMLIFPNFSLMSLCKHKERRGNALRNTRRWKWVQCSGMKDVWRFSLVTPFPFYSSSLSLSLHNAGELLSPPVIVQWGWNTVGPTKYPQLPFSDPTCLWTLLDSGRVLCVRIFRHKWEHRAYCVYIYTLEDVAVL